MKTINLILLFAAGIAFACKKSDDISDEKKGSKSIVVLFDNDVHCSIDGYSKMAGMRDAILAADTSDVLIVSSGDYINGGLAGSISKGGHIIEIMNAAGYDVSTIGNHSFDFGMSRLKELMAANKASVTCANFTFENSDTTVFAPYVIKTVGKKKIAFVGCSTPSVMETAKGVMYDKQGRKLYDMHSADMVQLVQRCVDRARNEGADYVIVLSHLGEEETEAECEWISTRMIKDTYGIDAVFDGHTHHIYADSIVTDSRGAKVHLSQTGTKFANIGKFWISRDGSSSASLLKVDDITYINSHVKSVIDSISALITEECSEKVGDTDYELIVSLPEEVEVIRCRETNLGNLAADAYADLTSSQIGAVASKSIRNNIAEGEILKGNILNTFIYSRKVCKLLVTGEKLVEFLTLATQKLPEKSSSFPQVSGLKFTIDISVEKPEISNVMVLDRISGQYAPIDHTASYETAIDDYYVSFLMPEVFSGCKELPYGEELSDSDCVIRYIKDTLQGIVSEAYSGPQGRISIKTSK